MSNLIGQSLGRYHILEQLGEGGMATVYKAYDTRLETDVAVKVIRTENILPSILERALKRFEREAKALAKLNHQNIVKVMDYGEFEGKPYLVMPYFPGGTLKQKLGKPIPWQEAIQLLLPIARALDFAHRQSMVHRDVKPSNILITADGEPMLTDFGIAKVLDIEETMDLTGTSAAVGTPEYMAPEQATAKTVDHRADIYALGIVFYEMVTGRKPYSADTPMAVMIMHAHDPLPRPGKFVSNLPDAVEKLLLKALAKDSVDRYQSMAEMAAAMGKVPRQKKEKAKVPAQTQFNWNYPIVAVALIGLVLAAVFGLPTLLARPENISEPTRTIILKDETSVTATVSDIPESSSTTVEAFYTPSPTSILTLPQENCDEALFVDDVTIPDGTVLEPNETFTKTWRLKNVGICSWTSSYALIFSSGEAMDGPATQALTGNVNSNQTVDISVDLKAPATDGDYKGYWKLLNASGEFFAQLYVDIEVKTPAPPAPSTSTITLNATGGSEGGTVYESGGPSPVLGTILAGDTGTDKLARGYMSFDISSISGKTVTAASVDLSSCIQQQDPFNDLFGIWVGELQYALPLDQSDYSISGTGVQLLTSLPGGTIDVESYVQTRATEGKSRFQIRLHSKGPSDTDGQADYMACSATGPKLTITYQP